MSKLFIVPTPIGNLEDITFRAIATLKSVNLILAEDTRTSLKLLNNYKIQNNVESYHMHNEHKKLISIIERLNSGVQIALSSDAGTPGISDPGFLLIRTCIENNIDVICLPGPTACICHKNVGGEIWYDEFTKVYIRVLKGDGAKENVETNDWRGVIF